LIDALRPVDVRLAPARPGEPQQPTRPSPPLRILSSNRVLANMSGLAPPAGGAVSGRPLDSGA